MCGRATLSTPPEDLRDIFGLDETPELAPRFNIAPTQPIAIVRGGPSRRLTRARFGLIPWSAKDPKEGARLINARVETLTSRGLFKNALERRRCLVVVDGFYEWKRDGKKKLPFVVESEEKGPFALAGLWDAWRSADGEIVDSCCIITTDARPPVDALHDRMPLVVPKPQWALWLDPDVREPRALAAILKGEAAKGAEAVSLVARPVSARVNNPANDDAACLAPPDAGESAPEGRQGSLL